MPAFLSLLRRNRNYRFTWIGQVVSEIGDHFNNIAVAALIIETTRSGLAVGGIMLARAIPAVLAGPVAGVALDRFDRRRVMIASDLVRAVFALAFVLTLAPGRTWVLYALSALLMFASPFFTAGRASILPAIASARELHTANSLTQTTQWATQIAGTILAGYAAAKLGFAWAFMLNAASFVFSAVAIAALRVEPRGFRAVRDPETMLRPWSEYREGLAYMLSTPLILAIGLMSVGWAIGGGAAQILFVLFGEQVFHRGPAGIGMLSGFAAIGLLAGGLLGHAVGARVGFGGYKRAVAASYISHGSLYIAFSVSGRFAAALGWLAASRVGMGVTTVLNTSELLKHTRDEFRGRVFSTIESMRWGAMILSMAAAGAASDYISPRMIGVVAGFFGALTGAVWAWADFRGRLPEPAAASESGYAG